MNLLMNESNVPTKFGVTRTAGSAHRAVTSSTAALVNDSKATPRR
jgi:hypothetical protein